MALYLFKNHFLSLIKRCPVTRPVTCDTPVECPIPISKNEIRLPDPSTLCTYATAISRPDLYGRFSGNILLEDLCKYPGQFGVARWAGWRYRSPNPSPNVIIIWFTFYSVNFLITCRMSDARCRSPSAWGVSDIRRKEMWLNATPQVTFWWWIRVGGLFCKENMPM